LIANQKHEPGIPDNVRLSQDSSTSKNASRKGRTHHRSLIEKINVESRKPSSNQGSPSLHDEPIGSRGIQSRSKKSYSLSKIEMSEEGGPPESSNNLTKLDARVLDMANIYSTPS
jgi:hypothetical protein